VALQLTGFIYKLSKSAKVSKEHLELLNSMTDEVTVKATDIKEAEKRLQNQLRAARCQVENRRKELDIKKRKQNETELELGQIKSKCQKLSEDLNNSQEILFGEMDSNEDTQNADKVEDAVAQENDKAND
jgi:uncharacterized phage infection (PIP) family protein YhgE